MATDQTRSSSDSQLPITNSSKGEPQICSVLPLFGFINLTICSGIAIYRAYEHGDVPMIVFVVFFYFATFLLDYCFRLYRKLPCSEKSRKHNVKVAIWVLLSTIMFGFAFEFSTVMSLTASLSFFGVVVAGNSLLFYVYFIWDGGKNCSSVCSATPTSEGKSRETSKFSRNNSNGKVEEEENKQFIVGVDVV